MVERGTASPDLLLTIQGHYPSLTRTEQRIADTLLADRDRIMWVSISEFGELAQVSDASIVRFCRKIGLKGFQELKLRLAQQSVTAPSVDTEATGPLLSRVRSKVGTRHERAVRDSVALVGERELGQAAEWLMKARRIHCFGTGASQLTAMDASYQLLRIGLPAQAFGDSHVQAMTAATLGDLDVVLGVSVSGSTKDTLSTLTIAHQNGARIIALTNYRRSPLDQLADVVLLAAAEAGPLEGGQLAVRRQKLH